MRWGHGLPRCWLVLVLSTLALACGQAAQDSPTSRGQGQASDLISDPASNKSKAAEIAVPSTFAIATGGTGGLYYPYGGGMASIWSEHLPQVNARAEVTGGSVTNVIQVARGESELGIAMADVINAAWRGKGRFPDPLPIRVLFAAYPNIVHVLTLRESGLDSITDLMGKRVSLGAAGSGTAVAAQNVLSGLGVDLDQLSPVFLNFSETTSALKDGTIDAGFVVGGLGLAAVTELAVTRNLQLIAITDAQMQVLVDTFPTYSAYEIPANTYNGQQDTVAALGIWSGVVVHEQFPVQLATALVCSLFERNEALRQIAAVAVDTNLANIERVRGVPLHPGAQRVVDDASVCE